MLNELQQHDTHFSFLMSRATSALRIRKEIMNRGLINRSIVLSCESAMPGVISKPVNYFTQSYSKTGLTLAAENLSHGAYAAIAAAVAAVAFLAWKVYRYFFKKETGEDPGKDSPSYKEVNRLNEKAKKITHEKLDSYVSGIGKGLSEGKGAEALSNAIREAGKELALYFPRKSDDRNELSDKMVTEK